jgi:hypothetical protein
MAKRVIPIFTIKGCLKTLIIFAIGIYIGLLLNEPTSSDLRSKKSDILIGIFSTGSKFRK